MKLWDRIQIQRLIAQIQDPAVKQILDILLEDIEKKDEKERKAINEEMGKRWIY